MATAVDSNITAFGVSENSASGLAWDGSTLYMVGRDGDRLYTVDRATGVATAVDSNITDFGVSENRAQRASLGRQYAIHGGLAVWGPSVHGRPCDGGGHCGR